MLNHSAKGQGFSSHQYHFFTFIFNAKKKCVHSTPVKPPSCSLSPYIRFPLSLSLGPDWLIPPNLTLPPSSHLQTDSSPKKTTQAIRITKSATLPSHNDECGLGLTIKSTPHQHSAHTNPEPPPRSNTTSRSHRRQTSCSLTAPRTTPIIRIQTRILIVKNGSGGKDCSPLSRIWFAQGGKSLTTIGGLRTRLAHYAQILRNRLLFVRQKPHICPALASSLLSIVASVRYYFLFYTLSMSFNRYLFFLSLLFSFSRIYLQVHIQLAFLKNRAVI